MHFLGSAFCYNGGMNILIAALVLASTAELKWFFRDGKTETESVNLVADGDVEKLSLAKATIAAKGAVKLEIVPEFAKAKRGEAGYWFSPYGLYGEFDRENGYFLAGKDRMSMPMFGWDTPRGAYLAIVTSLPYYVREAVAAKKGEYTFAAVLEEQLCTDPYEDLEIVYHRRPAGTPYAALAKIYREYQLKRGAVKTLRERCQANPVLEKAILAPELRIRQAWKPVPSPVLNQAPENEPEVDAFVTFDRVKDIVRELKAQQVGDIEICLVGWNIGGHDGRWPQHFPAEPKLGGDGKLKEAIKCALDAGYLIVPHGNFREGYTIADSWDAEWVIKHKDGSLMLYDPAGKTTWGGGLPYQMCPQRAFELLCTKEIPRMAAFGFKGIGYFDVVTICEPNPCWDPRHPCTVKDGARYWGMCAALSKRDLGGFASESGLDSFAGDLDYSLYTCFSKPHEVEERYRSGKGLAKRIVPIWQAVYNGIIAQNPFTICVNSPIKDRYSQLKAVEFSARPVLYIYQKFKHTGGSWMGSEDLTCATDEELKFAVSKVKEVYDGYLKLNHLQFEFLEDHRELAPGVFQTSYANGERLVVDYNAGTYELVK